MYYVIIAVLIGLSAFWCYKNIKGLVQDIKKRKNEKNQNKIEGDNK